MTAPTKIAPLPKDPLARPVCWSCEKATHMQGHILCPGCYVQSGGYDKRK